MFVLDAECSLVSLSGPFCVCMYVCMYVSMRLMWQDEMILCMLVLDAECSLVCLSFPVCVCMYVCMHAFMYALDVAG